MSAALAEVRRLVQDWPAAAALYRLCLEVPPTRERPHRLRWMLFDAGHYPKLAEAFRRGQAGEPPGSWADQSFCAAAWLAGRDTAGAAEPR